MHILHEFAGLVVNC